MPCKFPFKLRGKVYWACTFDFSHITGYKPWCSTNTDANDNHITGGKNWGICDDDVNCPVPPRREYKHSIDGLTASKISTSIVQIVANRSGLADFRKNGTTMSTSSRCRG